VEAGCCLGLSKQVKKTVCGLPLVANHATKNVAHSTSEGCIDTISDFKKLLIKYEGVLMSHFDNGVDRVDSRWFRYKRKNQRFTLPAAVVSRPFFDFKSTLIKYVRKLAILSK
jgi:hypothetical protein